MDTKNITYSILAVLNNNDGAVSSQQLARELSARGVEVADRTIRNYLLRLETRGLLTREGKGGRRITEKGIREFTAGSAVERVGFIMNRINCLSFLTDFSPEGTTGSVILNVTYVLERDAEDALAAMSIVLNSPYAMSDRVVVRRGGERLGTLVVPKGMTGIGTICSITLNGVFLKAGIPVTPVYGGVVDVADHQPRRFLSAISYDGSSVAPLEILIKGGMTDVLSAVRKGAGQILASLREIPSPGIGHARDLNSRLNRMGFKGVILFGSPGQSLLGLPVRAGKAGMVVLGGLNPVAALHEAGIASESHAMATFCEYREMIPEETFGQMYVDGRASRARLLEHLDRRCGRSENYWSIFEGSKQIAL